MKRKSTTVKMYNDGDIERIKQQFREEVMKIREADNIPEKLVLNLDETGLTFYLTPHTRWKKKERKALE